MIKSPLRKAAAVVVGVLVIASIAYCGAWLFTAKALEKAAAQWIAAREQDGYRVVYGEPYFTGFPWRAGVTFPGFETTAPASAGGWTWRTAAVRAWAKPLALTSPTIDLAGIHTVSVAGAAVRITAAKADVFLALSADGKLTAAALDTTEVSVAAAADQPPLTKIAEGGIKLVFAPASEHAAALFQFSLSLHGWDLPATIPPLARTIDTVRVVADLEGELGPGPLLKALDAWRIKGGTLEVRELAVDWPPAHVTASGTLALDEKLQPIGAFSTKFQGFFETVDALALNGQIDANVAPMAKMILGFMAKPSTNGSGALELSLGFTVQDRQLSAGPVALVEVPFVEWPEKLVLP